MTPDDERSIREAIWGGPPFWDFIVGLFQILFAVVLFVVGLFFRPNGRHRA